MSKPGGASISTQSPLPPTQRPVPNRPGPRDHLVAVLAGEVIVAGESLVERQVDRGPRQRARTSRYGTWIPIQTRSPIMGAVTATIAVCPSEGSALPKV